MERLREMIRQLPVGIEFLIVVSWAFGQFIFVSIMSIGAPAQQAYTNHALLSVLIGELMQFAFLIWFLRVRGWTLEKFGLHFTLRGTGGGLLLAGASFGLFIVAQIVGGWVLPIDLKAAEELYPKTAKDLDMQLVFVTSVVNGAYEELFVAGYIIAVLTPIRGMWTAINVSTGIRLLYHLYQGPIGVITIVPLGIVYGYIFARTRQLWPLIVAHIVIDVVGLSLATR